MNPERLTVCLFLISASALVPGAAWACTKDTDCKYERICVAGECVSPEAPGAKAAPAAPGKGDQKRVACAQKCEHAQSKCLTKIREGEADADYRRQSCFVDHQRCLSACGVPW